jgi:phospholipid/cholesterol/gamma-HCH transport system substrate-binding protein
MVRAGAQTRREEGGVSRSLSALQAILLGAAVLVGLGLLGAGLWVVGVRGWFGQDTFHVRAAFANVRGVEPGTRVRIQGVDAGEVVAVEPPAKPGAPVVVRLRVQGKYRGLVREDARVQIVSEGMIGAKVVEIKPGKEDAAPVADDALLASAPSAELGDAVEELKTAVHGLSEGKGPLGEEVLGTVKEWKGAATSVQKTAASAQKVTDAASTLPFFRNYVKDQQSLLIRANAECNYKVFREDELFEPGGTSLTAQGERRLADKVPWMTGLLLHKGAELVVVAYADARGPHADTAQRVTDRQSEAVAAFLKNQREVKKASSQDVKALGIGTDKPLAPVPVELPPAGVLVLVFVPR